MRFRFAILTLMLVAATTLVACGGEKPFVSEPRSMPVTIDEVRRFAQKAVDSTLSSDDRQQAREVAVRSLVDLLKTPVGARIAKADWEKPITQGAGPMLRVYEVGKVKVFGFPLPGPGAVPPGERVIVQFGGTGGVPQAMELPTMPGGSLTTARSLEESGNSGLTLAFTLARGGGYVAYYHLDSKAGEFRLVNGPLKGLPQNVGDLTLDLRDQFLLVNLPNPDDWRPRFDTKHPLRLFLNGDIALEWKSGKYAVLDERNFSALQGFKTALDPKVAKTERAEAWEKATRKLPGYLEELASWNEDLRVNLPADATLNRDQSANLAVRVVSVPAMEGPQGFTVIQYRAGSGLPQAQTLNIRGTVAGVRVMFRQGLPGLMILSAEVSSTGEKQIHLMLLRQTAGNDWEPAPEWFGWMPALEGWQFERGTTSGSLSIRHELKPKDFTGALLAGGNLGVQLCQTVGTDCQVLSWVGDHLTGTGWVQGKLQALAGSGSLVTRDQAMQAAGMVQSFLAAPETRQWTGPQVRAALGGLVQVYEPAPGSRVVALPKNSSGIIPVLIQGGPVVHTEVANPDLVDRWVDARVIQAGTEQWLLVLGRGKVTAVLIAFQWDGTAWQPAVPLPARVDRNVSERVRISYAPGQTSPVRGLYVYGAPELTANFTPDGKGVTFCEGPRGCLTYTFDKQWVLR